MVGDAEVEGCEGGVMLGAECCCCVGLRTVGEVGGTEGGRRSRPELLLLPLFIFNCDYSAGKLQRIANQVSTGNAGVVEVI